MTRSLFVATLFWSLSAFAQETRTPSTASPYAAPPSYAVPTPDAAAAFPTAPVVNKNLPTMQPQAPATGPAEDGPGAVESRSGSGSGTVRAASVPNEFQRFVAAASGRMLPVFGEGYFIGTAQTFAPLDRVPVPSDYVLGPGDELYIRVWGSIDIDYRATLDRNGQISIPRVGTFGLAGLKASEIEGHLRSQIGRVFKGFSLNVTLGQLRSIQIFVVGHARQPGTYTVGSLSTLVNAVFASGGPGPNGSMRSVQLRRGDVVVTELDLYDFIVQGNKAKDARLLPGDVIVYPPAGPRVAVLGAVDTPAIFELKPGGNSIAEVVSLAGGGRVHANLKAAQLERIDPAEPKAPRQVLNVDLTAAAQTGLRDGDMLTVFAVAPQFSNAVTLRGNVAAPLRYPYTPGMRVSQLIPEREALITLDYYVRKNRLVQFTEARKIEGRFTDERQIDSQFTEARKIDSAEAELSIRNLVDEPNWEYATIERLDQDRIATRLIPFHLGKAVLERDPENDLVLQAGDVVTIFSSKDIRGPQARGNRLVRVEGEVDRPGVYQLLPGETLRAVLARAGGATGQAYLFGTEFSRESTRKKQRLALQDAIRRLEANLASAAGTRLANLTTSDATTFVRQQAAEEQARLSQLNRLRGLQPNGRIALELAPSIQQIEELPDLPLEDGDGVLIPSRPGFVFALGGVVNDNAILWRPGRTVKDYLLVAGVAPEADEGNTFVLRADGSVIHNRNRGLFSSAIDSLELAPGDTVVVPELLNREGVWSAFVRGLKDWTQILSQFGLAAAAIQVLSR